MITVVRPSAAEAIAFWSAISVWLSTLERASSSRSTSGSDRTARAIATRCLWPPERFTPRSPIIVSYPCGSDWMKSCACAIRAARSTSSRVASGLPNAMFSAAVAEKRNVSWNTRPIRRRSSSRGHSRRSTPSRRIAPSVTS